MTVLKPLTLTKRQIELLEILKDGKEALVYDKGWRVGLERTSGRTAYWFIRFMLVSEGSKNRFYINKKGTEALKAGEYFIGFQLLKSDLL